MIPFWVVLWAAIGFGVSYYIAFKKHQKKPLVCMVGAHCDLVVHSKYNALFGIPNEVIGMMYYSSLILFYFANHGGGLIEIYGYNFSFIVFLISCGALFVSAVLTYIQGAVLKNWCTWCLISALMNLLIVIFEYIAL